MFHVFFCTNMCHHCAESLFGMDTGIYFCQDFGTLRQSERSVIYQPLPSKNHSKQQSLFKVFFVNMLNKATSFHPSIPTRMTSFPVKFIPSSWITISAKPVAANKRSNQFLWESHREGCPRCPATDFFFVKKPL